MAGPPITIPLSQVGDPPGLAQQLFFLFTYDKIHGVWLVWLNKRKEQIIIVVKTILSGGRAVGARTDGSCF
jgi:hypothetical protein